eukprot:1290026-Pyramimonas_sp.AAC.3
MSWLATRGGLRPGPSPAAPRPSFQGGEWPNIVDRKLTNNDDVADGNLDPGVNPGSTLCKSS